MKTMNQPKKQQQMDSVGSICCCFFGDELKSLTDDVSNDVVEILKLAKSSRAKSELPAETRKPLVHATGSQQAKNNLQQNPIRKSQDQTANELRENVTTRLTRRTNELLTEASLRQKLKKVKPDSRQDIIECAILEWLKRHGFKSTLSDNDSSTSAE